MKKLILPFCIALLFYSCDKKIESVQVKKEVISSKNLRTYAQEIISKDGILEVGSFKDLEILIEDVTKMNKTERKIFSKNYNFNSLQDLFDEVVTEEAKIFDLGNNMSKEAKGNLIKFGFVSELGIKNKDIFKRDKETGIEKNINIHSLSYVINPNGIIKIGKNLYKYEKNKISFIENATNLNLSESFNINENNIKAILLINSKNAKVQAGNPSSYNFVSSNVNTIGSPQEYKVLGYWNCTYSSPGIYGPIFTSEYRIKALKRGFLGYWYNWNTDLEISGSDHFGGNQCAVQPGIPSLSCGCGLDLNGVNTTIYKFVSGYNQVSETTTLRSVYYDCSGPVVNNYWNGSIASGSRSGNITFKAGFPAGSPYVYTNINATY